MYTVNRDHNPGDQIESLQLFELGTGNNRNNHIEFHYPGESFSYDEGKPKGRVFAFQFDGRAWFYQHIRSEYQEEHDLHPKNESYECFARLPLNTDEKCYTYYTTYSPVASIYKWGSFQLDSMMYFIARYHDDPNQWMIQEYSYNPSDAKFHFVKNIMMPQISTGYTHLGGIVKRLGANQKEYQIINLYNEHDNGKVLGKLIPEIGNDGTRTFSWTTLFENDEILDIETRATSIVEGTVKACRNSDINPQSPDRLQIFAYPKDKSSDGYRKIPFKEYRFEDDVMIAVTYGEIESIKSSAPRKAGDTWQVLASYELQPMDFTTTLEGIDGYQQYLWIFYPNEHGHFNGLRLQSDQWRLNPGDIVTSEDLSREDLYDNIKDLWTLVGIIDGPPPVSVSWEILNEEHAPLTPPSFLSFKTTSRENIEITNSTEDNWSVGQNFEISSTHKKRLNGSLSEEFKYSHTFKNKVSNGTTKTISIEKSFELHEDNQNYGFYIWCIPSIKRYSYSLYPWWDNGSFSHPIANSFQYLFRTMGYTSVNEALVLQDYPFQISEPNDSLMSDWKERQVMKDNILNYDLPDCVSLDWDDFSSGSSNSLNVSVDSTTTNEKTNTYEVKVEAGFEYKVPKVFQIGGSVSSGYEGTYSSETKVSTEFEQEITASLEKLESMADGLNISHLHMKGYWFRPETNPDWWFYDSLWGYKPWYLAWIVNTAYDNLQLLSPGNGSVIDDSELMFNWQSERGSLSDYTFYILKSQSTDEGNILLKEPVGDLTYFTASDFKPEKGITYYWVVRGISEGGTPVWSPRYAFTTKLEPVITPSSKLKAVVYPNPAPAGDINIMIDARESGKIEVSLFEIGGNFIGEKELQNTDIMPVTLTLSEFNLMPGVYFAVLSTPNEQLVKKIMIR